MKTRHDSVTSAVVVGLLLAGAPGIAGAQSNCEEIDWKPEMTARFPRIAESCVEVVERDGIQYAKFQAAMDRRFNDGRVKIRIFEPNGQYYATTVDPPPGFLADFGGRSVPFEQVPTGQRFNIYVPSDRWVIASVHEAAPEVVTAPIEAEPEMVAATPAPAEASLPATASALPLIALFGGFLGVLGAGLSLVRRR